MNYKSRNTALRYGLLRLLRSETNSWEHNNFYRNAAGYVTPSGPTLGGPRRGRNVTAPFLGTVTRYSPAFARKVPHRRAPGFKGRAHQ
jgi:hypothetical protein